MSMGDSEEESKYSGVDSFRITNISLDEKMASRQVNREYKQPVYDNELLTNDQLA